MPTARHRKMSRHLVKAYTERFKSDAVIQYFVDSFLELEHFIEFELKHGHPVCVRLQGQIDHFTVIAGMDKKRYYLFDSHGHQWIKRSSLSFEGRASGSRYVIDEKSVFSIGGTLFDEEQGTHRA